MSNRIEVLDSGMVKLCAEVSLITFSSPDRLLFQIGRPMSTYFEVTVMSLNQSISSLSFGFSQPRRASGDSIAIGQPRSACSMLLSSFSITCNGSPVSNLPEDFVALLREHGKQQGTVFGVHLDSAAGCVTFSVAAFASPVASSLSSKPATDAAAAAPANTAKPVPTKLQRHTVQWTPTDRFQPFIELMQGSIHVNSGEAPFLLEVPSGASDLLTQVPKHAHLSPPVATLLAAYRGDKVVSQNCNQAVTSALVAALKHVLSDAPVQLAPLSAQSNATPSFLQAISDYEHDLAVLTNLLQDQEIFSALFRASQEEELKQIFSTTLLSFLAPSSDLDTDATLSAAPPCSSISTPRDGPCSAEQAAPASVPVCGVWADVFSALSSLPQIAVALGSQVTVSATPGTDDFAQRAASSLFDSSPPPSPRNLSPVPRESRSLSIPDADITSDVFRARRLACRSKFSAWLLDHTFLQATSALLGISDAQTASEVSAESSVSAMSIWQNVFANFVQSMSYIIPILLSKDVPEKVLNSFCVAMHCAGAVVAVKNATVSFLDCLLKFLENTFKEIGLDKPVVSKSRLLITHIPSYVLACSAQHSIDRNSKQQLDPFILQHLHSPMFDGGFLESFSKWKFLDDFGSRQSGVSGTQKAHTALSSFYEEIASDTKSGSLWLSIFSLAVVNQAVDSNGANSKDAPMFKSEAFKAALSTFLHISGFAEFCSSIPDTPDYIRQPISKDTLRQLSPQICILWETFFKEIVDQLKTGDQSVLLSHCRMCLSLAPPSAAVDGNCPPDSADSHVAAAETLLQRRISGSSAQGADIFVAELIKYLNSSIDDKALKSIAAERDLIIQSRSFGFQILRKLLQLVELVDDEFTLEFCRGMLCCVEMCFAPIVANERGSAHVVVGLSGTNRKSQQRMQSEWTQVMRCVLDTMHKVISGQFVGSSSEVLPLNFFLLNLFQQDTQWLKYGGDLINDILTIASGLDTSLKELPEAKAHLALRDSQDFPAEGFAACAIADGEWLCHGGIIVINGVRTIFSGFWFIQDGQCHAVSSDHALQRAWHTLSIVHSNELVIIGGASMIKSSGLLCKAKVAIVKVNFDRASMSVKLTGIPLFGFRSPVMHSAVTVSDSPISPVILVIGGLGRSKSSAQLICINAPDTSSSDSSQIASQRRRSSGHSSGKRHFSPPPSPPRPSIPCIAAPVVYRSKVVDVSPPATSSGVPFCFGSKPAVHRISMSDQVIVSTISFEACDSQVLCFNYSNPYSWCIIPLEGWPMDRYCVVGSSFLPLSDGSLLLVGGEDETTGDIATPVVISLRNFSCKVLDPIPELFQFAQHHSFVQADSDKCNLLGNWRAVPHQQSYLNCSSFNLRSLRISLRVRGLRSVLSGLCAQAVLVPSKGFKIPILSPLLWTLQGKRLAHAHEEVKMSCESIAALPPFIDVVHEPAFSVSDSVIEFLDQGPQLIGLWLWINASSKFSGMIFSIGANDASLCSLEIDACRYLVMKSVSGVSSSPSSLPTNCWVHIAVSFLPATIPQFCLYLNGYRMLRKDGWVSPLTGNLRSKDLGVVFGNKRFILCVGHRQGADDTATISRVCLQKNFEFTSPSCFDISSIPPPSLSRARTLHRDIGSVLQSLRSVPIDTLSHIIQSDGNLLLVILDLLFNGSVSLAGPCALILVSLIKEFPSLYTPESFDRLLSAPFAFKLCEAVRIQSLNPGSFANRHHRNIYVFILRELLITSTFQPCTSSLLMSQLTSVNFDGDLYASMDCCKQALAFMDVFSNRLCLFPGLNVLVSPSPSSPSTRCTVMRVSADDAAVYIKSPSAQSYSCEIHPISHLQHEKSDKNSGALPVLPPKLLSPFWKLVSRVLEVRPRFQDAIHISAFLDILLENSLQVISGALASESSIDLSSFSESLVSQLLDLSFESTTESRIDEAVTSAIVDTCLRLGWTVSKSATSMILNSPVDGKVNENESGSCSWMHIGSRPVVKSRNPTDAIFHAGVNLQSGTKLKVGVVSSAAVRAVCNSLKGSSPPQALISKPHPYRRATFQITGEFFQPYPPAPVPVEDCLSFKLLTDGPRTIVSQNFCSETEGLFCSFAISAKEYSIMGLVPSTQLHMTNQQIEEAPVFFSPKIGQAGTEQFRAVAAAGQELTGWKEGQTITMIADPVAKVVSAFVEDTLVGAFRCDCRNMRFCIS